MGWSGGAPLLSKARENVDLAIVLVNWKYADGAANRLYYALYHAGWAFLDRRGRAVPDHGGTRYYRHEHMSDCLEDEGFQWRLSLPEDWHIYWTQLKGLRVKADYFPDSVRLSELDDEVFAFVQEVVEAVQGFERGL